MGSLRSTLFLAGALVASSSTVFAADLLPPPPRMEPIPVQAPVDIGSGWYLRGDVGVGILNDYKYEGVNTAPGFPTTGYVVESKAIDDQSFISGGIGYQFNSWLRADATAEYRGTADFKVVERDENFCIPAGGARNCGFNTIGGKISSVVGLVNLYADLGTFYGFTPFIGAGVGFAHNRVTGAYDIGSGLYAGGIGVGPAAGKTGLAYAVHAGLGYDVSPNLKLEIGYRYLNMGEAETGVVACNLGPCPSPVYKVKDLDSHDIKIGMRWLLAEPAPAPYGMPIIRKY